MLGAHLLAALLAFEISRIQRCISKHSSLDEETILHCSLVRIANIRILQYDFAI